MNKRLTAVFAVVLCMALSVAFGMSVTATENDGSNSSVASVSSEQAVISSTDATSSSVSSDTSVSSDSETGSEQGVSSEMSTSSTVGTSSEAAMSSEEDISSDEGTVSDNTTSSKPNNPITSGGAHDSNTHIEQTGSELASDNMFSGVDSSASASSDVTSSGVQGEEQYEEEEYQGKASYVANWFYKLIWIPIVMAVLCIAGLVVVNVMFRKKYPKAKQGASRRERSSSYEAPKRRGQK